MSTSSVEDTNLVIDDDYVQSVGQSSKTYGANLEALVESYLAILNEIKAEGIVDGAVSEQLAIYLVSAIQLKGRLETISSLMRTVCNDYIVDIDNADVYLF